VIRTYRRRVQPTPRAHTLKLVDGLGPEHADDETAGTGASLGRIGS
jgi:hypothetical protein